MIHAEEMANALSAMLVEVGGNADGLQVVVNRRLGEHGIDPEAVAVMGQNIVHMAVQAGESPENTIAASFAMGMLLGAQLGVKP